MPHHINTHQGRMARTKADMVEHLFNEIGLNKKEAKDIVDVFFNEIKQTLATGEQIKLSGFGKFELRDKVGRPGRNTKTRESVPIAPRRVITHHILAFGAN